MYESYFGLDNRPFASIARTDRYFPAEAIEYARQTLIRCIQRAEGAGIVIGPSGTGKTLLCHLLAENFQDEFAVALLASGRLSTRRALFQAILYEIGQPYRGMDEGELRLALVDYLTTKEDRPRGLVLLVDEAQTLPLRLLEEIRLMTNLVADGQPRTRLVLVGGPTLEERFASPRLESFTQRISARCYLQAFSKSETQQYIQRQVEAVGGRPDRLFSGEACHAVHAATDGIPRLINQLCDHALLLAFTAGRRQVDRAVVDEAWSDLQQLPTPWGGDGPAPKPDGGVVEFGSLADDDDVQPRSSVPLLRVTCEADLDDSDLEPTQRLEKIERTLAGLDDQFEPTGPFGGPEVTLLFEEVVNPFDEEFAEEELVMSRFAPVRESEPAPAEPPPDYIAPLPSQNAARMEPARVDTVRMMPSPEAESVTFPASEPRRAAAGSPTATPTAGPAWNEGPQTVLLRREVPEPASSPGVEPNRRDEPSEEEPLIVVEDGYEEFDVPHARRRPAVRRQEYRQLFARLRRSS